MKKKILLLMGVFAFGLLQAQVGINTTNPLGAFHVDPKGNTQGTSVSPTNDSDDVIVDNNGNLGIGTAKPAGSLDVRGAIRINDGTQGEGNIFTTDGTGLGYWDSQFKFKIIQGVVPSGTLLGVGWIPISATPLVLTEGKWLLATRVVTKNDCESTYYTWIQMIDLISNAAINAGGIRPAYDGDLHAIVQSAGIIEIGAGEMRLVELQAQNHAECAHISEDLGGSYFYAIKLM